MAKKKTYREQVKDNIKSQNKGASKKTLKDIRRLVNRSSDARPVTGPKPGRKRKSK